LNSCWPLIWIQSNYSILSSFIFTSIFLAIFVNSSGCYIIILVGLTLDLNDNKIVSSTFLLATQNPLFNPALQSLSPWNDVWAHVANYNGSFDNCISAPPHEKFGGFNPGDINNNIFIGFTIIKLKSIFPAKKSL